MKRKAIAGEDAVYYAAKLQATGLFAALLGHDRTSLYDPDHMTGSPETPPAPVVSLNAGGWGVAWCIMLNSSTAR